MKPTELHLAPLQGYTEVEYRRAHRDVYGGDYTAYTPFLRMEKGEIAQRGMRDAESRLNQPEGVVPQIIVGSSEEFVALRDALKARGAKRIDINMGCPFPPQVKKGRGAGLLRRLDVLSQLSALIASDSDCRYSVKMRAGVDECNQWREVLPILNATPLEHIALHPRIATDQYRGTARREVFADFAAQCSHPLIYNGDINSVADIHSVLQDFPQIKGVMIGRGLLARPSLFAEYTDGEEWSESKRKQAVLELHSRYRSLLEQRLCGDHQLLAKLQPFWEYLEAEIGRKAWKAIRKTANIEAYNTAVNLLSRLH